MCNNGDIRLAGGTTALEGRVEICNNQAWGTVCDDLWGGVDAGVACVQLGYQRAGKLLLCELIAQSHDIVNFVLQEQQHWGVPSLVKVLETFSLTIFVVLELRQD